MEAHSLARSLVRTGSLSNQFNYASDTGRSSGADSSSLDGAKQDRVTLSREGQERSAHAAASQSTRGTGPVEEDTALQLDRQEIQELRRLKLRDAEVRTHEQAHLSAAGRYARGGASFTFEKGPDGNSYAVGGEVGIDTGKESTPEATLVKMQAIRRAALAPANPSAADRRIASQASISEAEARQELLAKTQESLLQAGSEENTVIDESQRLPHSESGQHSEPSYSAATFTAELSSLSASTELRPLPSKSVIAAYNKVAAY